MLITQKKTEDVMYGLKLRVVVKRGGKLNRIKINDLIFLNLNEEN